VNRSGRRAAITELDSRARAALARRYPTVAGYGTAIVVTAVPEVRARVMDAMTCLVDTLNEGERLVVERLVRAVTPPMAIATPEALEQANREAQQRARILHDFGAWRAAELPSPDGSRAGDRSQVAYRWRRQGRILGVHHEGALRFLGFQFDARGAPLPVVAEVIRALGDWTDWEKAMWFVLPNARLDLRRPVDMLGDDPTAVVAAAEQEVQRAGRGRAE